MSAEDRLSTILSTKQDEIVKAWTTELLASGAQLEIYDHERLSKQCHAFVARLAAAMLPSSSADAWAELEQLIAEVATSQAELGISAVETARFVFAFKRIAVRALGVPEGPASESFGAMRRLDEVVERLALHTFGVYATSREALIRRQADSILELSCPIIKIWEGALLCVVIGTVDSARAQDLLEAVLGAIREQDAQVVILDITGVAIIDTKVLQHLFTIVRGTRFMGAKVVITGVTPAVAATVSKLHVDLSTFQAKSTLRAGLREAFGILGVRSPEAK